MDFRGISIEEGNGLNIQGQWIPVTPSKPIPTRPQTNMTDRQVNQFGRSNWRETMGFPAEFFQVNPLISNGTAAYLNSTSSIGQHREFNNLGLGLAGNNKAPEDILGAYAQSMNPAAGWNNIPYTDLLALADAASEVSAASSSGRQGENNAANGPYFPFSYPPVDNSQLQSNSASMLLLNQNYSNSSNQRNNIYSSQAPQYVFPVPYRSTYDLNSPPRTIADEVSNGNISFQFAPVTPDKGSRMQNQPSELVNIFQEKNKLQDDVSPTGNNYTGLHCQESCLQSVVNSSSAAIEPHSQPATCAALSNPSEENNSPEKGEGNGIDLNKTPQQKPRRKKHRPRVVIEGKPKRTPKSTVKQASSKENQSVKRKYVRKNRNKATNTPSTDVVEITDPNPSTAVKSCKRSLKFNLEGQEHGNHGMTQNHQEGLLQSNLQNTSSHFADSQAKDIYTRHNDSSRTPTLQFAQGLEVMVENSSAGIAFDLNRSLTHGLDDYISSPEITAATTPPPTKDLQRENLKALAREIHEARMAGECQNSGRNYSEGIGNPIFPTKSPHSNHENGVRSMLQSIIHSVSKSPSNSNSSRLLPLAERKQERVSKRAHSHTLDERGMQSLNVIGNFNSLQAYHEILQGSEDYRNSSNFGILFPEIYKKRRTEKSRNTITTGTSNNVATVGNGTKEAMAHSINNVKNKLTASQANTSQHCNANGTHKISNGASNSMREHFSLSVPSGHICHLENTLAKPITNKEVPSWATNDKLQPSELLLTIRQTEWKTRKRSKAHTRVRDLATLTPVLQCNNWQSPLPRNASTSNDGKVIELFQGTQHYIESPAVDKHANMAMSKYKKGPPAGNMVSFSSTNDMRLQEHQAAVYDYRHYSSKSRGLLEVAQKFNSPVDEITQKLNCLNINSGCNMMSVLEQNALVPFRGDGRMVPYEGLFDPIKKRRPRPKVDLDSETERVWKLLMGKEASNDVEGTDAEKEKWWEEERRVFRGRADSFIARMHLIQGDRRFSQWNGSVVDSVIGVFLTQNVSDHLSSSAFMSLAARFPPKSISNEKTCNEEGKNMYVEEPEIAILYSDVTKRHEIMSSQGSVTLHEAEHMEDGEMDNSNRSLGSNTGDGSSACISNNNESVMCQGGLEMCHESLETKEDILTTGIGCASSVEAEDGRVLDVQTSDVSPQNSVDSSLVQAAVGTMTSTRNGRLLENTDGRVLEHVNVSQNSVNSFISQKDEVIRSCSDSNSEEDDPTTGFKSNGLNSSTSFMGLLQMAGTTMLQEYYSHGNESLSLDLNSEVCYNQSEARYYDRRSKLDKINEQGDPFSIYLSNSKLHLPQAPIIPIDNYRLHVTPNSEILEVDCSEPTGVESRYSLPSIPAIKEMRHMDKIGRRLDQVDDTMSKSTVQQMSLNPQAAAVGVPTSSLNTQSLHSFVSSGQEACLEKQQHSSGNLQMERHKTLPLEGDPLEEPKIHDAQFQSRNNRTEQANSNLPKFSVETLDVEESTLFLNKKNSKEYTVAQSNMVEQVSSADKMPHDAKTNTLKAKGKGTHTREKKNAFDWDCLRKDAYHKCGKREKNPDTMDSLDWEAVRCADVNEIAKAIKERGMNNMLAERIKDFLNRLVREHESIDLEWLRDVPPDKAKEYLLSVRGLGLKSVECVRLLTLHQLAFPVDTNVGRIAVRLGWVPLQPLPESLQLHLLEMYPVLESIQKYLWPRLCTLDQRTLYELHYQLITFGKVFCTKSKPNCNACPLRAECKHFASAFASARLALPGPEEKGLVSSTVPDMANQNPAVGINSMPLPLPEVNMLSETRTAINYSEPIIEVPASPEPEYTDIPESDIEDAFYEDPDEIPTIKLNIEDFASNLHNYMQENNMELLEGDVSKALVALNPEAASIPTPKLKNMSRLRTEHQVYELPDSHPLLKGVEKRVPGEISSYLLAIWTPGETAESTQPPEKCCSSQISGNLCNEKTCFSCNSVREANSQTVRGTLLIPCKTAMRGSFPLNGTYFQVNEVFADHDSSLNPIDVPRAWLWNLPRRTVFFGTSIPTIFKGQTTEQIQSCFWRGYVCVRGFDQKTRAPRPLMARLHFPASKLLARNKAKGNED